MRKKISANEFEFVFNTKAVKRLKYFIHNISDCGRVWFQQDGNLVKCWPFEEFAHMSNAFNTISMKVKKFYDFLLKEMHGELRLAIFPNEKDYFDIGIEHFLILAKNELEHCGRNWAKKLPGDDKQFYLLCNEYGISL